MCCKTINLNITFVVWAIVEKGKGRKGWWKNHNLRRHEKDAQNAWEITSSEDLPYNLPRCWVTWLRLARNSKRHFSKRQICGCGGLCWLSSVTLSLITDRQNYFNFPFLELTGSSAGRAGSETECHICLDAVTNARTLNVNTSSVRTAWRLR